MMPINIDILKEVDKFLIERARVNDRDYSYFHASEWDRCHRKKAYAYYEGKGLLKVDPAAIKIDPVLQRIFDHGHKTHDRWKDYLYGTGSLKGRWMCMNFSAHPRMPKVYGIEEKFGIFCPEKCECGSTKFDYVEVSFSDAETWLGGHVDAILDLSKWPGAILGLSPGVNISELPPEDTHMIVDFKTMSPYQFKDLSEPKSEHITQINLYLYLSGLKIGKLVYEDKADQKVKQFLVPRDENLIQIKKAEAINLKYQISHTNNRGLPVLPPKAHRLRGHDECVKCKFRGHCWK